MIKECVILNGKIINIGEWDFKKQQIEISPAEVDEDGNVIKDAVFEEQIKNPMPEGVTIEERNFEYDADRGWYEVGTSISPTVEEQLQAQAEAIMTLMEVLTGV